MQQLTSLTIQTVLLLMPQISIHQYELLQTPLSQPMWPYLKRCHQITECNSYVAVPSLWIPQVWCDAEVLDIINNFFTNIFFEIVIHYRSTAWCNSLPVWRSITRLKYMQHVLSLVVSKGCWSLCQKVVGPYELNDKRPS